MNASSLKSAVPAPAERNHSSAQAAPLVSIIIPTFNHAHYLNEAIHSALQQTYGNLEVIVVDDGSTDGTREAVADFPDRVRYIWQQNQGLSAARNTGLRAARGELIGLLDADDLYEEQFVDSVTSFLLTNSEVDAVVCRCRTVDPANRPLPQIIGKAVPTERLHSTLLDGNFFPPLCMFAYRYCYEQVGFFDRSLQGCADWDMWLRMAAQFHIASTDQILVRYRIVPNSMSHDPDHMLRDRQRVVAKHFAAEPDDERRWSAAHRRALGYCHLRATVESLQAEDRKGAYQQARRAFKVYPKLALSLDVFYELGLGGQPQGYRNDFGRLNVDRASDVLLALMGEVFDDPQRPNEVERYRRSAYADAYLVIGLLYYGARQFGPARSFLLRSIKTNPRNALKRQCLSTFGKTLLGPRMVDWLKRTSGR